MKKPERSSFQYLSISYECALAIGNSLNLPEMLHEVIYKMVHKTNAHRGIIWVKNGEKKLQPVASAGINIKDVQAQDEIMDTRDVLNQILKKQQYVLRYKGDKDFLQYCPVLTEKEEAVLIVSVSNVAIIHLVYAGSEIADEPLANLLAGLSEKLSVAIEACMAHKNIINEVQVRVEAEEKIKHLNLVLRAIRNVNQLIVFEKNRDVLIQKVCEILTEDRGYSNAWLVLLGKQREYINSAEAGLGKNVIPMKKMLEEGKLTNCGNEALKKNDLIIIKDPKKECLDCPFSANYSGLFGYTICIKHGDNIYGLLSISASGYYVNDKEEQSLFKEVAGDIGFALYNIEVEEKRKQSEELLQKSEARLRQVIDTVPHFVFAKDRDGRFIMANKAVADGCGTTPENMVGKTHPELPGANTEQYQSYLTDDREVIDSGKLKFIPEEVFTHYNGHKVIMETTKIPFTSAGIPAVLGVSVDITERKQAEEELKKHRDHLEELVKERTKELKDAQEELIRNEQLAILGQFSGSISHELRNPLAVIDSSIYYLKMKLKESDKTIHQHLERIGSSVISSTTIIDSLLSLTRMKKPEMSRNNLISLVSDSIRNTKIPDKVKVIQDFPDEEILVNVEYEQCRIAFKNIINNACEAMDNNGTLTVSVQKTKENKIELSFKDTGHGIAAENIEKIFLPLFSTKARGIGFGLSITKMIIENHGGTLCVKSESGKGANFIISLPLFSPV